MLRTIFDQKVFTRLARPEQIRKGLSLAVWMHRSPGRPPSTVLPTEVELIAELERERRVIEQQQNGGET